MKVLGKLTVPRVLEKRTVRHWDGQAVLPSARACAGGFASKGHPFSKPGGLSFSSPGPMVEPGGADFFPPGSFGEMISPLEIPLENGVS
jgi:hypothetical protein